MIYIYNEDLAPVVMEAEMAQGLPCAGGRPRRAGGAFPG